MTTIMEIRSDLEKDAKERQSLKDVYQRDMMLVSPADILKLLEYVKDLEESV